MRTIAVQTLPGAKRTSVEWTGENACRIKVNARPVDGQANAAVAEALAEALGVRVNRVELFRGGKSRSKLFHVREE